MYTEIRKSQSVTTGTGPWFGSEDQFAFRLDKLACFALSI